PPGTRKPDFEVLEIRNAPNDPFGVLAPALLTPAAVLAHGWSGGPTAGSLPALVDATGTAAVPWLTEAAPTAVPPVPRPVSPAPVTAVANASPLLPPGNNTPLPGPGLASAAEALRDPLLDGWLANVAATLGNGPPPPPAAASSPGGSASGSIGGGMVNGPPAPAPGGTPEAPP